MMWLIRTLVLVGALNWGLIGFFNFNLVEALFGIGPAARIVYSLVGISAVVMLVGSVGRTPARVEDE